ncbi:hypothetical protein CVT25_002027, partial [Psilocybe cyanescens]
FYSTAFPEEHGILKAIVYVVYLLELTQTVLITKTMFRSFVYGFLDKNGLDKIHDYWLSVPVIGASVACIVQLFYAYRIVVLARCFIHTKSALIVIALSVIVVSIPLIYNRHSSSYYIDAELLF